MGKHVARWLQTGSHQHGGPNDRVEAGNVLTHQLNCGPAPGKLLVVRAPTRCGDVVQEGLKPHIGHVVAVEGQLDAPIDVGARNGEILQAAIHKRHDLVFHTGRLNEIGPRPIELQQLVLELAHFEEVVLFFEHLDRSAVDLADLLALKFVGSFGEVRGCLVFLTPHAVETLVFALINEPVVVEEGQELLNRALVALLRGANKVIVGKVQGAQQGLPRLFDQPVCPLLGRNTVRECGAHDLLPVLVSSCQKPGVDTGIAHPPGQRVSGDFGVGMPNMRHVIHIENRCRDKERIGLLCGHRGSILRGVPDTFLI